MKYLCDNKSLFPFCSARSDVVVLIGCGSFSRVVCAEHRVSHQPFAIKMMEVRVPEGREVFAVNWQCCRGWTTNVIQLIEVFQFPQWVCMVPELATCGELLDREVSTSHFTKIEATWCYCTCCVRAPAPLGNHQQHVSNSRLEGHIWPLVTSYLTLKPLILLKNLAYII